MQFHPRTIRDGLTVGGIAYLSAVALYSLLDVLAARDALFTADMLGRALFMGLRDPAIHLFPHQLDRAAVLWSGGLQLALSTAAGLTIAGVVGWAGRHSVGRRWVVLALLSAALLVLVGVDRMAGALRPVLPWTSIVVANTVALTAATTFLFTRREVPVRW